MAVGQVQRERADALWALVRALPGGQGLLEAWQVSPLFNILARVEVRSVADDSRLLLDLVFADGLGREWRHRYGQLVSANGWCHVGSRGNGWSDR